MAYYQVKKQNYLSVIEKWADSEEQTVLYNLQGQSLQRKLVTFYLHPSKEK